MNLSEKNFSKLPAGIASFKDEKTVDSVCDELLNYFNDTKNNTFMNMNRKIITKEEFMSEVILRLQKITPNKSQKFRDEVLTRFKNLLWGFDVLEPIINNPDVSDIRIVSYDNIRYKERGKRKGADYSFKSQEDADRFVNSIAVRNAVNLSTMNAIQTFTDNNSHPDYTLRFTVATGFVTSSGNPVLHIRKLPKEHKSLSYFKRQGLLVTEKQIEYLKDRIKNSSFLIVGQTGSGKTTFYNGLLDYVPCNKSVLIIQENDELNNKSAEDNIAPHPEMMFLHTVSANGEGKIEYSLQDLARMGLLFDVDYFGIGEVKGAEAKYLLNCIKTGSLAMCTAHGSSIEDGMEKIADYITYETKYTVESAMKMLERLNTVIFVENFRIERIAEVIRYNAEKGSMEYRYIDLD